MAQPGETGADGSQDIGRTIAVLYISGMDDRTDQQPASVGQDVTLAALDLIAQVIAARPPLSVVFTLWLSIAPALGETF